MKKTDKNMILSNSALDKICKDVVNSNQFYWSSSKNFFSDLYMSGCRSMELLLPDKWKIIDDKIELTTLKTEAKRLFPLKNFSEEFQENIIKRQHHYRGLTYNQFTLEFRKVVNEHPIYMGKKKIDTYLFRYNRARKIFDETNDMVQLMDFFGWKSMEIAHNYIIQPLRIRKNTAGYL